ncbi:hypothetical protein SAMN05444340_11240 [Citreimonas salinaria]|uniref:Uncharacterized protein n=2 Tax=Citreimonas salinaria TaxID=321339 RepID=A0A1H3LBW8_9RHOB|nr:hypothetical protein SAMN05444340_11240 [Citreimonas salinaria]
MQRETSQAAELMSGFAERTGLRGGAETRRYLWTDAFAVINALDLWLTTRDERWRDMATDLVAEVHGVLGRHRSDDSRQGWLGGLDEQEGARHPTSGGLRIGKPLPEREPDAPYDARLEWDRDGQYWHYLTKWMDALSRAARVLDEPECLRYAEELAEGTFPRFLQTSPMGAPMGLAWKMSVDLSRPQVAATSPHDALDGYVTTRWLGRTGAATRLAGEANILRQLAEGRAWGTADPLGLGGLLMDAMRLALLPDRTEVAERLILDILAGVDAGLDHFLRSGTLEAVPSRRLGFREIGLAIGLQALRPLSQAAETSRHLRRAAGPHLDALRKNAGVGRGIVAFWSEPENRRAATWTEHRDINDVMLATVLLDAYADTARATSGEGHRRGLSCPGAAHESPAVHRETRQAGPCHRGCG